ncbi:MAG: hypothetical protein U5R06_24100 [candidate division KSB1 bacterium]|nr:hypothetical protein [candidate division KSB1 bacterium]
MPKSDKDIPQVTRDFLALVDLIKNEHLKKLLESIFTNESVLDCFQTAAAGKLWHHNYSGGLLEHSYKAAKICLKLARLYPDWIRICF